jgi:transposase InsO family protein
MSRHWFKRPWRTRQLCNGSVVSGNELLPARVARFSQPPGQPQAAHRHGYLAQIKEQSRLRLGNYSRPRMTEEMREDGTDVGHRRVGRLIRENRIVLERARKFKATLDSDYTFNIAPNLLDRNFHAPEPNRNRPMISVTSGPARGGCIWL